MALESLGSMIGSIAGNMGQSMFNQGLNNQAFDHQANTSYRFWLKQQEYNSPAKQMARLVEAGINPALVYGNGVQNTANSAPETPQMNVSPMTGTGELIQGSVGQYLQNKEIEMRQEDYKSQIDARKADIEIKKLVAVQRGLENEKLSRERPFWYKQAEATYEALLAKTRNTNASTNLLTEEKKRVMKQVMEIGAHIDMMREQGKQIQASVAQKWAEIAISKTLADSQVSLNDQERKKLVQDTANAVRSGNLQYLEYLDGQLDLAIKKDKNAHYFNSTSSYRGLCYNLNMLLNK